MSTALRRGSAVLRDGDVGQHAGALGGLGHEAAVEAGHHGELGGTRRVAGAVAALEHGQRGRVGGDLDRRVLGEVEVERHEQHAVSEGLHLGAALDGHTLDARYGLFGLVTAVQYPGLARVAPFLAGRLFGGVLGGTLADRIDEYDELAGK